MKLTEFFKQSAQYFWPFVTKCGFSRQIFINVPNTKFHGNSSTCNRVDVCAQTDRGTDERTKGRTDGRKDERTDERTNGRTDGLAQPNTISLKKTHLWRFNVAVIIEHTHFFVQNSRNICPT